MSKNYYKYHKINKTQQTKINYVIYNPFKREIKSYGTVSEELFNDDILQNRKTYEFSNEDLKSDYQPSMLDSVPLFFPTNPKRTPNEYSDLLDKTNSVSHIKSIIVYFENKSPLAKADKYSEFMSLLTSSDAHSDGVYLCGNNIIIYAKAIKEVDIDTFVEMASELFDFLNVTVDMKKRQDEAEAEENSYRISTINYNISEYCKFQIKDEFIEDVFEKVFANNFVKGDEGTDVKTKHKCQVWWKNGKMIIVDTDTQELNVFFTPINDFAFDSYKMTEEKNKKWFGN